MAITMGPSGTPRHAAGLPLLAGEPGKVPVGDPGKGLGTSGGIQWGMAISHQMAIQTWKSRKIIQKSQKFGDIDVIDLYTCVCVCIHMYIYIYMCVCTYVCIYIYVCVCSIYIYMCVCVLYIYILYYILYIIHYILYIIYYILCIDVFDFQHEMASCWYP